MEDKKIFISGATGFIGSHMAELAVTQGFKVMALKRNNSNLWRCADFANKIVWVDDDNWEDKAIEFGPDIILHLAWEGISSADRENWEMQFNNLQLLMKLMRISKVLPVTKFIAFGSQAEYGSIEGRINETIIPEPNNAYGIAKLAAQNTLKLFCEQNEIEWYWLRIYSVFGPREDKKWFIPMVINNLLNDIDLKLTQCEQQYDYIYVKDLVEMVFKLVKNDNNQSGIYNISSDTSKSLKTIISEITQIIHSNSKVTFGAIDYRRGQSMHIEGDCSRYQETFGKYSYTDLNFALKTTIESYKINT